MLFMDAPMCMLSKHLPTSLFVVRSYLSIYLSIYLVIVGVVVVVVVVIIIIIIIIMIVILIKKLLFIIVIIFSVNYYYQQKLHMLLQLQAHRKKERCDTITGSTRHQEVSRRTLCATPCMPPPWLPRLRPEAPALRRRSAALAAARADRCFFVFEGGRQLTNVGRAILAIIMMIIGDDC